MKWMHVFLTVDAAVSCRGLNPNSDLAAELFGETAEGSFGIEFQSRLFGQFGLRASFFVDPLFTVTTGLAPLKRIVAVIAEQGHDVQLQLHPEWLKKGDTGVLPAGRFGDYMKDFSLSDQRRLIEYGLNLLGECGAENITAFRAGDFGGNNDTLRAASQAGIAFDTTYNCVTGKSCEISVPQPLYQPMPMLGVNEIPITYFRDGPRHSHLLQFGNCSRSEIQYVLEQAMEQEWFCVVINSHVSDLLRRRRGTRIPDKAALGQYIDICQFLADNDDRFAITRFSDLSGDACPARQPPGGPIRSQPLRSLGRQLGRVARRLHS